MENKIKAEIVADSLNEMGNRITTVVVYFPRMILAEMNTHRMFSRNSASSRAIPFEKMVERMFKDARPSFFTPIAWQKDHKGMQGTEYFEDPAQIQVLEELWQEAAESALGFAQRFSNLGVTKQLCNRLLEPFMYHKVIITATEWENFFHLRCPQYPGIGDDNLGVQFRSRKQWEDSHPKSLRTDWEDLDWKKWNSGAAEIHAMEIAECIWDAYNESKPKELKAGEWHIPFGDRFDKTRLDELKRSREPEDTRDTLSVYNSKIQELKVMIATARCARVSYENYEGTDDYFKDVQLYERLSSMGHWSPFEHCAQAMSHQDVDNNLTILEGETTVGTSGNFIGFKQLRKRFRNENVTI